MSERYWPPAQSFMRANVGDGDGKLVLKEGTTVGLIEGTPLGTGVGSVRVGVLVGCLEGCLDG